MKICQVTNVDFALRHFILPLMRGARARGHEVIGICADGPMLEIVRAEGFRVIPVPMARAASLRAQWRALRSVFAVLRAERPDMVHGHMPISGLVARLAARLAGVPQVAYTCHGFLFNQPGPWRRRAAAFVLEWLGARLTDRYLTVSTEEAADARRLHIAARATPVGNGRDPARFHPDPEARARIRTAFGIPAARVVVCVVSRLVRHKGHPELLAAMRELPGAELWVVGNRLSSDRGEDLAPVFAAAGLGSRLRLLGYRDDIPALLAAADIFALPSHFEGLPMSVIEAMLVGLPVVATNIRGPREQVVDGETGLLVPPRSVAPLAAALSRLANDASLRARMGDAGRARALDLYDEAKVLSRTLDALGL
jgi:glycosyltransferase involved in cell wall biosynthesis